MFVAGPHPNPLPRGEGAVGCFMHQWFELINHCAAVSSVQSAGRRAPYFDDTPNGALSLRERAGVRALFASMMESH